jgi:hypothetical protein
MSLNKYLQENNIILFEDEYVAEKGIASKIGKGLYRLIDNPKARAKTDAIRKAAIAANNTPAAKEAAKAAAKKRAADMLKHRMANAASRRNLKAIKSFR